jgi:DsbC/DsbD-like thiol-disulfide interchange protein
MTINGRIREGRRARRGSIGLSVLCVLGVSVLVSAQATPNLQFRGAQPLSKHAAISTAPAALTAAPGGKVALFVDMTPNPGVHVYAPGAKDYIAVKVTLKPQADLKAGKITYPKSEMLFFAPLNETVPVYQKAFRLEQEVTLAKSVKAGSTVTVAGTLDFQACDDKVCFVPESVPVSWTVTVK